MSVSSVCSASRCPIALLTVRCRSLWMGATCRGSGGASTDATAGEMDSGADGDSEVGDAGRCSADRWCQVPLPDDGG